MKKEYNMAKKWIPKDLHKGRCTPGSPNYDCPKGSPQWRLAQTFKKHHGFHEAQFGDTGERPVPRGTIDPAFSKKLAENQYLAEQQLADKYDTGYRDFSTPFKIFNAAAQFTTGIANEVNDIKARKQENFDYIKALQNPGYENYNESGLNNNPIYTKNGGMGCAGHEKMMEDMMNEMSKMHIKHGDLYKAGYGYSLNLPGMPYGGGPLTSEGAKEILRDGSVHGHPLTPAQKRYFGYIAGGGKPHAKYGIVAEYGVNPSDHPNVEAEGGEVYQDTTGGLKQVSGASHENGGVLLNDAERVLEDTSTSRKDRSSQTLKLSPEVASALTGINIKKDVSHSEAMDMADKFHGSKVKRIEGKLKGNVKTLQYNKLDKLATNSMNLNLNHLNTIPTNGDIFDNLFQHQELVKQIAGIDAQMAKCGGKYKCGGKAKKAQTGIDNAEKLNDTKGWTFMYNRGNKAYYKRPDGSIVPTDGPKMSDTDWKTFLANEDPQHKADRIARQNRFRYGYTQENGPVLDVNPQIPDLTDTGIRPIVRSTPSFTAGQYTTADTYGTKQSPAPNPFNEPLHWYDVAGPIDAYLSSGRIPNRLNPAQLHEVRLKLQNPLPTLQQGQADYAEALKTLPNNGVGYSNLSTLFGKKFGLNNQVLGQYENINSGIKNQETLYNANVKDRQSILDQVARDTFENKYLGSLEAQRQQRLTALDDLYTRIAQNRKLNREGNLMMKLFPNFDQYANYNGRRFTFRPPVTLPSNLQNQPTKKQG